MPKLLSGSTLRKGGSGEFLDLRSAQPQLPPTDTTGTGYTLVTDALLRTSYRSSLGNLEINQGEVWSNLPEGIIKLTGTGTGYVLVTKETASTSTTTGALVVNGGIGIGQGIYTGEDIYVNGLRIGQGYEGVNNITITAPLTTPPEDYIEGQENIIIGYDALKNVDTAYKSIAIGRNALGDGTYITRSISIGDRALQAVGTLPAGLIKPISTITVKAPTAITGATSASPVVITSNGHGLTTGDRISIEGVEGLSTSTVAGTSTFTFSLLNEHAFFVNVIDGNSFSIYYDNTLTQAVNGTPTSWVSYIGSGTIVNPIVVTAPSHGLASGLEVIINDVVGAEEINDTSFWIYVLDSNRFQLFRDNILAAAEDGSDWGPYVSGGTVHKVLLKNNNIAIGSNAGNSLYDGEQNFFLGDNIAPNMTTGSYNFFMGHDVATYMTRGNGNISIMGDNLVDGQDNQVNIGGIFYYNGDGYLQLNADTGVGLGTESTSTNTGAFTVLGGMGISGDLWVGGTLYASFSATTNLAYNLAGGVSGDIPYQTGLDTTDFLAIGDTGTILISDGSTPYWGPISALSSNTATNSDNVFVNSTIPTSVYYLGLTELIGDYSPVDADNALTFDTTDNKLTTAKLAITSTASSTSTVTGQALVISGGVGINEDLFVAKHVYSQDGIADEGNLLYTPKVTVNATPPANPRIGDIWIDSGGLYLQWIKDGVNKLWIQVGAT